MSNPLISRPPLTDAELIRDIETRLRALERATTVRFGSWTLADVDGQPVAVAPGQEIPLDGAPIRTDVDTALRASTFADQRSAGIIDTVVGTVSGTEATGHDIDDMTQSMSSLVSTVQTNSTAIQHLQTAAASGQGTGQNFFVNFNSFPDGPMAPQFTMGVTPDDKGGDGYVEIKAGMARWHRAGNGLDNSVIGVFNDTTTTDYQYFHATIGAAPQAGSRNYAILRYKDVGNYTYACAWLVGLQAYAELGCYVGGVKTVLVDATKGTLDYNLYVLAGDYANSEPYRFQLISGTTTIIDYTDIEHVSQIGPEFRGWGFRSDTAGGGRYAAAPSTFVGCADNAPVGVAGNGLRVSRRAVTPVVLSTGADHVLPANFWDTTEAMSDSIDWDPVAGKAVIKKAGWVIARLWLTHAAYGYTARPLLWRNSGGGLNVADASGATNSGSAEGFGHTVILPVDAGDELAPGYFVSNALSLVAEATGTRMVFALVLAPTGLG